MDFQIIPNLGPKKKQSLGLKKKKKTKWVPQDIKRVFN